jgi:hypothetical protein
MGSIQDAIRQRAAAIDEHTVEESHEPSTPTTPTLLGIARELRTRICEYALYREEGGGVICPSQTPDTNHSLARYNSSIVLKAGERWTVRDGRPVLPKLRDGPTIAEQHEWLDSEECPIYFWEMLPTCEQHHSCNLGCLNQLALTRVSRQIRDEVNVFHCKHHIGSRSPKCLGSTGILWSQHFPFRDGQLPVIHEL